MQGTPCGQHRLLFVAESGLQLNLCPARYLCQQRQQDHSNTALQIPALPISTALAWILEQVLMFGLSSLQLQIRRLLRPGDLVGSHSGLVDQVGVRYLFGVLVSTF